MEKAYRLDPRVAAYKEKLEKERIAKEVKRGQNSITHRKKRRRRAGEKKRRGSRSGWKRSERSRSVAQVCFAVCFDR